MKVLIVTPTLGISPWLDETVASVREHAMGAQHVLVAPAEAADAVARRFPRTRVVAEPGGGMYAAINAALRAVEDWEAFTYLNDDDVLLPAFGSVRRMAEINLRRNRAAIVYGGVRLIDANGRRLGAIPISPRGTLNRALYAERLEPVYQHGTIISRRVVDAIGVFDETLRFCGDSELLARACVRQISFLCATRREVAAFRLRAGQLTKNREAMTAERALVDTKLGLRTFPHSRVRRIARLVFRAANAGIYFERIVRHGFVSFDELLAKAR